MFWKLDNKIINLEKITCLEVTNNNDPYSDDKYGNIILTTDSVNIHVEFEEYEFPNWYIEFLLYVYSNNIAESGFEGPKHAVINYNKTLSLPAVKDLLKIDTFLGKIYNEVKYLEETRIGGTEYVSVSLQYSKEANSIVIFMIGIQKYFDKKDSDGSKKYRITLKDHIMDVERFAIDVEFTTIEDLLEAFKTAYNKMFSKLWNCKNTQED